MDFFDCLCCKLYCFWKDKNIHFLSLLNDVDELMFISICFEEFLYVETYVAKVTLSDIQVIGICYTVVQRERVKKTMAEKSW